MIHVLVVDDNELVRYILERYLKSGGYQVSSAGSGVDAIALCETAHVDVLVTDQNMPGMKGTTLITLARALQPELRCILISADPIGLSNLPANVIGMEKPLSKAALIEVVAAAGKGGHALY
jgi:CheY-like chemotaxis protein